MDAESILVTSRITTSTTELPSLLTEDPEDLIPEEDRRRHEIKARKGVPEFVSNEPVDQESQQHQEQEHRDVMDVVPSHPVPPEVMMPDPRISKSAPRNTGPVSVKSIVASPHAIESVTTATSSTNTTVTSTISSSSSAHSTLPSHAIGVANVTSMQTKSSEEEGGSHETTVKSTDFPHDMVNRMESLTPKTGSRSSSQSTRLNNNKSRSSITSTAGQEQEKSREKLSEEFYHLLIGLCFAFVVLIYVVVHMTILFYDRMQKRCYSRSVYDTRHLIEGMNRSCDDEDA